jgi:hypothetical protein
MRRLRPNLWLLDHLNAFSARRMLRRQRFPDTLEKAYWYAQEFDRDANRLGHLGYAVVTQTQSKSVLTNTLPPDTGGVMGHRTRTVSRPLPSFHVFYRHYQPAPAPAPLGPV